MRLTPIYVGLGLALAVQANFFGGGSDETKAAVDPYTTWTASQLRTWLDTHNIEAPHTAKTEAELRALVAENWNTASAWTYDQYASAQKAFADLRDTTFEKWDESMLREWLLKQGVVSPKGPREKLVLMAQEKYREYTDAASSFSDRASATAGSVWHGVKNPQELGRSASDGVVRVFDHSRDYVYSTWDEAQLRNWLVEQGLLKPKEQKKKDDLIEMVHNAWGRVANPVYHAWSDSYLHDWLVSHNVIAAKPRNSREYLLQQMQKYYYDNSDEVWSTWSDSTLHKWLVDRNIIKSDAQVSRDKMLKMVQDNFFTARDTFWRAWSDNQLHEYLVANGYIRSDAQKKRDELVALADQKYNDAHTRTAAYLAWPDARLRAYLRQHGMSEDLIPGGRPGLLQETRIRWVQAENNADTVLQNVKDLVNDSAHKVEDVLARVLQIVSGGWVDVRRNAHEDYDAVKEGYQDMKRRTDREYEHARDQAGHVKRKGEQGYQGAKENAEDSAGYAKDKWHDSREYVGEKVQKAGEEIKGQRTEF